MLVLALDTTTRAGSVALVRDGVVVDVYSGDPHITHGQRLPGDILYLLDRQHVALPEVDLFAVAAGPGSFTGLRIGIAAMQGFALAHARPLIGISALDALHDAVRTEIPGGDRFVELGAWIDAHRGEVFSALYSNAVRRDGPSVDKPDQVLARWTALGAGVGLMVVGDGAVAYRLDITRALPAAQILTTVPLLAPAIGRMAARQAETLQDLPSPDVIQPIYVRRPDAELARDRAHQ